MTYGYIHQISGTICKAKFKKCPIQGEHYKTPTEFINYQAKEQRVSREKLEKAIADGNSLKEALEIAKNYTPLPKIKKDVPTVLEQGHIGRDGGVHYWLKSKGKNVAYAKVYVRDDGSVSLCDIETKEEFRNQGFAGKLLKQIAEENNVEEINHDGGYTPNGFDFIANKLNRVGEEAKSPEYKAMDFVHDWDERYITGS